MLQKRQRKVNKNEAIKSAVEAALVTINHFDDLEEAAALLQGVLKLIDTGNNADLTAFAGEGAKGLEAANAANDLHHIETCAERAINAIDNNNPAEAKNWLQDIVKFIKAGDNTELPHAFRKRQDILFRGPARVIAAWMEEQSFEYGGPCYLPPLIEKALKQHMPDWMVRAYRATVDHEYSWTVPHLMSEFTEAINKLPLDEQRQLLADIKSGKFDEPPLADEEDEL